MINFNESDINMDLAIRAHSGTSFVPEKRGRQYVDYYMAHMAQVVEEFTGYATEDNREAIAADLEAYRLKYLQLLNAMLHAKSNCISTMIAGPSKFPVERARKASNSADKRTQEWLVYQEWKLAKLRRTYNPRMLAHAPIRLDDPDVVEQLEKKIARLKANQEAMKAANKIIRNKKLTREEKIDALVNEVHFSEETAAKLLVPDWSGKPGIPTFELSNNNANIKRLEGRLAQALAEQSRKGPDEYPSVPGVEVVENTDEVRIQLVFEDKPPKPVREVLKQHGFRWAPSQDAWQRLLNANGRSAAKQVLRTIASIEGEGQRQ